MKRQLFIPLFALLASYAGMLLLFYTYVSGILARHTDLSEKDVFWSYAALSTLAMIARFILIVRGTDAITNFLNKRLK